MMAMALISAFGVWGGCRSWEGGLKTVFPGLGMQHWTLVLEIRAMPSLIEVGFPPCRKHSCFCLRKRLFTFLFHIIFPLFKILWHRDQFSTQAVHAHMCKQACTVPRMKGKMFYKKALQHSRKKQYFLRQYCSPGMDTHWFYQWNDFRWYMKCIIYNVSYQIQIHEMAI